MAPDLSLAAKIYKLKSLLAMDGRKIESRKFDYSCPCPINEDLNIIIKITSQNQKKIFQSLAKH